MRDLYIKNSDGFIIVYSIVSRGTFDELGQIYNQIMSIKVKEFLLISRDERYLKQKEQPAMILVGNKVDLSETERTISRDTGQTLADQWMCPFYETSAKTSINVEQVNICNSSFSISFFSPRSLWI